METPSCIIDDKSNQGKRRPRKEKKKKKKNIPEDGL